jgi:hypothetical protein
MHQSDGASASAGGGVAERLRQLMLPLVAVGQSYPPVFSGQELSSETVIDGSLGLLARPAGALVAVGDLSREVLEHSAALLLQAEALVVSQPPAPVAMPWPAM